MDDLNVALVSIGGLTLVLSLVAGLLKSRVYVLSEPLVAVLFGVLIGPAGLELLALDHWGEPLALVEQVTRLAVGLAVVGTALRLPRTYFLEHLRSLAVLLVPGQLVVWAISGALASWLLDVPFLVGMLVGAVVTPTDPVLAGTIVTGETATENVPDRLRYLLSGEAGANDGGAYPLVLLPILLIQHPVESALSEWLSRTLLWEVLLAVALGLAIGGAMGVLERWSHSKDYLEETSLRTVTIALTFTVLGGVKLLGSDAILAAFAAGLAFNRFVDATDRADEQNVQEVINRLFAFPVFVFFGMVIPWDGWLSVGWAGVALAGGILLFRRLPMVFAFRTWLPPLERTRDALFVGWFGPIGVAAVFYATVAVRRTGAEIVWVVVSLVVASSVLVHGVTATPFTRALGRAEEADSGRESPTVPTADGSPTGERSP